MIDASSDTLTIRQAFERHYEKDELSRNTLNGFRHHITAWERFSGDPDVRSIDNATLARFRTAMLEAGYSPSSVNTVWKNLRAILRRIGPAFTGNPWGLGIITQVPAMKPVREVYRRPVIVSQDDLARVYVACRHAKRPRTGLAAADWWRCLLVLAYFTGLRRSDLFSLRWEQIDLTAGTMDFSARKTGKADIWPLHPVAVLHLERLRRPDGDRVFRGMMSGGSGGFYRVLHELQTVAKVTPFGLHDLRRTGASLIEQVAPGLGPEFLQHAPRGVSDVSYLNRFDALRGALEKMPVPAGWRAGPKVAARREAEARQQRVEMRQADFIVPTGPVPSDWRFRTGAFGYRGRWFPMPSASRLAMLRELVNSTEPVPWTQLADVIRKTDPGSRMASAGNVAAVVANLRGRLRQALGLSDQIDPLPCVQHRPSAWWLWIQEGNDEGRK